VGFSCAAGIGVANADFFTHLPFARWLVVPHPRLGLDREPLDERCHVLSKSPRRWRALRSLVGMNVLFRHREHPHLWDLVLSQDAGDQDSAHANGRVV
jgi:hypothetical protein